MNNITIQERTENCLEILGLFPMSVFYTTAMGGKSILSITFYNQSDLNELLRILDYKALCDKSGYELFRESNTILIESNALLDFYLKFL
jgi:hypothetical protein